jgi:hypothetical protein
MDMSRDGTDGAESQEGLYLLPIASIGKRLSEKGKRHEDNLKSCFQTWLEYFS